jgi:hypothetical protein
MKRKNFRFIQKYDITNNKIWWEVQERSCFFFWDVPYTRNGFLTDHGFKFKRWSKKFNTHQEAKEALDNELAKHKSEHPTVMSIKIRKSQ